MAKIPLPERGQPLDVAYIYQLANAINDLATQVSPSVYKYVTVDAKGVGQQSVKASEARVIGGYIDVVNNTNITALEEKTFSYSFPSDYKYAPIVTATLVNVGGTDSGKDASIILKPPTTSKVEGTVRFNKTGNVSVAVNLLIVGIPN
jgi:hypothetical protein